MEIYYLFKKLKEQKDIKTLQFWVKYLLPKVGRYLNKLDLSNCKSLNNNLVS